MKRYTLIAPPTDSYDAQPDVRYFYVDPRDIRGIAHNPKAEGCGIYVEGIADAIGITASPEDVIADKRQVT